MSQDQRSNSLSPTSQQRKRRRSSALVLRIHAHVGEVALSSTCCFVRGFLVAHPTTAQAESSKGAEVISHHAILAHWTRLKVFGTTSFDGVWERTRTEEDKGDRKNGPGGLSVSSSCTLDLISLSNQASSTVYSLACLQITARQMRVFSWWWRVDAR